MLVTTASPCWRAIRHSDRWPSCRLPIVGTKATRLAPARCSASSAAVLTISMRIPVVRIACSRCCEAQRNLRSSARAPETIRPSPPRRTPTSAASMLSLPVMKLRTKRAARPGWIAERVVDYQHLARAGGSGADADHRNAGRPRQRRAERRAARIRRRASRRPRRRARGRRRAAPRRRPASCPGRDSRRAR